MFKKLCNALLVIFALSVAVKASIDVSLGENQDPRIAKKIKAIDKIKSKEKSIIEEVKYDLIRVRDELDRNGYYLSKSYTKLIDLIERGFFDGNMRELQNKLDNLLFYTKTRKGFSWILKNKSIPFLEKGIDLIEGHLRKLSKADRSLKTLMARVERARVEELSSAKKDLKNLRQENNAMTEKLAKEPWQAKYLSFLLLIGITLGLWAGRFTAPRKIVKKQVIQKTELVDDFSVVNSLEGSVVLELNKEGKVTRQSNITDKWFEGSIEEGTSWNEYLNTYFYKDSLSNKEKNFYRHYLHPQYFFRVKHNTNNRLKKSYVEIERVPVRSLINIGKKLYRPNYQVDIHECLDKAISTIGPIFDNNFAQRVLEVFKVSKGSYEIYLNPLEARGILKDYLYLVGKIITKQGQLSLEKVDVSREEKGVIKLRTTLSGGHLRRSLISSSEDNKIYTTLNKLESDYDALIDEVTLKNISQHGKRRVIVELAVKDLASYVDKVKQVRISSEQSPKTIKRKNKASAKSNTPKVANPRSDKKNSKINIIRNRRSQIDA